MLHRGAICKHYRAVCVRNSHMRHMMAAPCYRLSLSDTGFRPRLRGMDMRVAQALVRFGLGRRGDESLPTDPAAWLTAQLRQPDPARIDPRPGTAQGLEALRSDRATKPLPEQRR